MLQKLAIILALFSIALAQIEDDFDCGSLSELQAVEFTGCTRFPCTITADSVHELKIRFVPSHSMVVKSRITYQWDGLAPEIYDEIDDFVTGGEVHTHSKAGITVVAPQSWGITFKWELLDSSGRVQVCGQVLGQYIA